MLCVKENDDKDVDPGRGETGDKELSAHQHKGIVIAFILVIIVIILSQDNRISYACNIAYNIIPAL